MEAPIVALVFPKAVGVELLAFNGYYEFQVDYNV